MIKYLQDQEIIFGIHPIIELLRAKRRKIYSIYTTKIPPKAWVNIQKLLPKYTNINYVEKEALNKLSGTIDHQSVVAFASPLQIRKKFFDSTKQKFLVMLDGIQDPRNLGAILRSAYCTGVDGVIITQRNSSAITPIAIKSSAGLSEHLEIYLASSGKSAVQELNNAGYSIFLATLEKSKNVFDVNFKPPLCIVIGSEGEGISKNILDSGTHVTLPQKNSEISYNASVAAGILLFLISTHNKII